MGEHKTGVSVPPLLTKLDWLIVYHGVHELEGSTPFKSKLYYAAGVLFISE